MIQPDAATLLEGVAHFLENDLKAALAKEPALAFRVLIAAHLCRSAALEGAAGASRPAVDEAALAEELRSGGTSPEAAIDAMMTALAAELAIVSPRFDLRLDIEARK